MENTMKIAWIGLGLMGSRMVQHLTNTYEVHVYNRTLSKNETLKGKVQIHTSIKTCVKDAKIVIMMLSTPDVVEQIYTM